jgi:hypothetical protein
MYTHCVSIKRGIIRVGCIPTDTAILGTIISRHKSLKAATKSGRSYLRQLDFVKAIREE